MISPIVYDLIADKRTVKIEAHDDDVNSCCWADSGANVLISASDDSFLKVWYVLEVCFIMCFLIYYILGIGEHWALLLAHLVS